MSYFHHVLAILKQSAADKWQGDPTCPQDGMFARAAIDLAAQTAEIARLRAALLEARDCLESWGSYAETYFQLKHDLRGDIERINAALGPTEGPA